MPQLRPVLNVKDLTVGMFLVAKFPGNDCNNYWSNRWGGLIEVTHIYGKIQSIDGQILNGGQNHGLVVNYTHDELRYLAP